MTSRHLLLTVVSMPQYLAKASKVLTDAEQKFVEDTLSMDPEQGDVMQGTGGVRKVRIALEGRGKSGGARVVYYFYNDSIPVFLLTVFAKNEKDNLSKKDRNDLAKLVKVLRDQFMSRR